MAGRLSVKETPTKREKEEKEGTEGKYKDNWSDPAERGRNCTQGNSAQSCETPTARATKIERGKNNNKRHENDKLRYFDS